MPAEGPAESRPAAVAAPQLEAIADLGIALGYVLLRVVAFSGTGRPPILPDTIDFERVARLPLWRFEFYSSWKPWLLPLFYKLIPGDTQSVIPPAQWLVSIASWLVLAFVVAGFFERFLRLAALILVLGLSLTPLVSQWDGTLLSESLSLSASALLLAGLLVFVRNPSTRNLVLVLVAAAAFATVRDTNAFVLLLLALPIAVTISVRGPRQAGLVLAVGVLAISVFVFATYNVRRWQIPLGNVIAGRVLTSGSATSWFKARGMPVGPDMRTVIFRSRVPAARWDETPELAYFRPWFHARGRRVYAEFLVTHPHYSLVTPIRNLRELTTPVRAAPLGTDSYRPPGYRDVLPGWLEKVFYLPSAWLGLALATLAALGVLWRLGHARVVWLVPAAYLASVIPHALLVWDGDWTEVARHSVQVGVTMRLGVVLALLFLVDDALRTRRHRLRVEP